MSAGFLLSRRARYDGNAEFEDRYRRERPKVQALSQLAGGNPRLVVMLYEILGQRSIGSVVETLRQLADELTPLLKDIVEHRLAGQQSKILDAIMRAGGTATPADVARSTRLSLNTVTTQLRRLRDAQIVEVRGGGKGRAAYYTVADPLFSVWYQMRYLRPQRRKIEMFVEVLRIWFETEERCDVLRSLIVQGVAGGKAPREMAVAAEYYAASLAGSPYSSAAEEIAVKNWLAVGDLREAALALAEFRTQGTRQSARAALETFSRDTDRLDRITNALQRSLAALDPSERAEQLVRLLASLASPDMRRGWPTVWRAILGMQTPETAGQFSVFTAIAEALERHGDLSPLDPLPPEQREFALEVLRKFEAPTLP